MVKILDTTVTKLFMT